MGCTDDIILIQTSGLEDSSAIQDLKVRFDLFFFF